MFGQDSAGKAREETQGSARASSSATQAVEATVKSSRAGRRQHGGTSKYRGVSWDSARTSWRVSASVGGKYEHFGYFMNEEVAAKRYDMKILDLFAQGRVGLAGLSPEEAGTGSKAKVNTVKLNFPDDPNTQLALGQILQRLRLGDSVVLSNNRKRRRPTKQSRQVEASQEDKFPYIGVHRTDSGTWVAFIEVDGNMQRIGNYSTALDAARAYDRAAFDLMGMTGTLNFPESFNLTPSHTLSSFVSSNASASFAKAQPKAKRRPLENKVAKDDKSLLRGAPSAAKGGKGKQSGGVAKRVKRAHGSSNYRGVSWFKANSVWKAQITVNGKYEYLGYYDSEEEAARAYDKRALDVLGINAQLNFPIENYTKLPSNAYSTNDGSADRLGGSVPARFFPGTSSGGMSELSQQAMVNQLQANLLRQPMSGLHASAASSRSQQHAQQTLPNMNLFPGTLSYFPSYPPYTSTVQQTQALQNQQDSSRQPRRNSGSQYHFQLPNAFGLGMNQAVANRNANVGAPNVSSQNMSHQSASSQRDTRTGFSTEATTPRREHPTVQHQLQRGFEQRLPEHNRVESEASPGATSNLMQQLGITPVQLAQELSINLSHFLSWLENHAAPQNQRIGVLVEAWYQHNKAGVNSKLVDIRSRIKSLMLYIGVTQLQVAKELGLHASTVSEWFNGRKMHTRRIVQAGSIITRWIAEKLNQTGDPKLTKASESLMADARDAGVFD